MFLNHMRDDQKRSFMVLAHKLAMCDGEDASSEEAFLAAFQEEAGIAGRVPMDLVLKPLDLRAFNDQASKVIVLVELMMIAYADGFLADPEGNFLAEIAQAFGLTQQDVDTLALWVAHALALGPAPDPARFQNVVNDAYRLMGYR